MMLRVYSTVEARAMLDPATIQSSLCAD